MKKIDSLDAMLKEEKRDIAKIKELMEEVMALFRSVTSQPFKWKGREEDSIFMHMLINLSFYGEY